MASHLDHGAYVNLEKTPSGKLEISLTQRGREEFKEFERLRDRFGIHQALLEVLADHLGSGWDVVRPEEIGALTSALILSDEVERDEEGQLVSVGYVYWNPRYQIDDEIEELGEKGFVLFDGA